MARKKTRLSREAVVRRPEACGPLGKAVFSDLGVGTYIAGKLIYMHK